MREARGAPRRAEPSGLVAVERLAAGGDGVGRIGGKVVFLPLTAPGDVAEIAVEADHRSWCRGRVVRLATASPIRIEPSCPAFGVCGGCCWQHLPYPEQLAAKRALVEDALRRIARLDHPPVPALLPSPRVYGYRHRARFHAVCRGTSTALGFHRRGSRDVVPLDSCPVLHPGLSALLPALAETARLHPGPFRACREIRADADWAGLRVRLALRGAEGAPLPMPRDAADTLRRAAGPDLELLLSGGEPLRLARDDDALITTGEAFTQVNLEQNGSLVRIAMELAAPARGEGVLDLYCGLGNLSLPAARHGARVTGIDLDTAAVVQAEANAARLGLAASFRSGDAARETKALAASEASFDLVMLNPPRTGARDTVPHLPALRPSRILMVSCDPATFARDAALLARGGYRLAALRPLDLFPQTAHVETIALFLPAP